MEMTTPGREAKVDIRGRPGVPVRWKVDEIATTKIETTEVTGRTDLTLEEDPTPGKRTDLAEMARQAKKEETPGRMATGAMGRIEKRHY